METTTAPMPSTRRRILDTAHDLFYRDGIRSTGIDAVVATSGVAKMTLYRHFPSKDELVAAYLQEREARFWLWFDAAVARGSASEPRQQLMALFEALAERVCRPDYRGCPFLIATAEFPEPGHPARFVVRAHKLALRERLRDLAARAGSGDPDALAEQLMLLMDGAYASALDDDPIPTPARIVDLARILIAAHLSAPSDNGSGHAASRPRE